MSNAEILNVRNRVLTLVVVLANALLKLNALRVGGASRCVRRHRRIRLGVEGAGLAR